MNKNMGLRVFSPISYPAARLHTSACGWEILLKVSRKSYIMWNNKPIYYLAIWKMVSTTHPWCFWDIRGWFIGFTTLARYVKYYAHAQVSLNFMTWICPGPSPTIHCPRILSVQCGLQQGTRHLLQPVLSMCTHFVGCWVGQFSLQQIDSKRSICQHQHLRVALALRYQ